MRRMTFLLGGAFTALLAAAGVRAATQQLWDKAAFDAARIRAQLVRANG